MTTSLPRGIWCPLATPLRHGKLDESAFRLLIRQLVSVVDGVVVLGSTGQCGLLPDVVADHEVSVATEELRGRVPYVVGVVDASAQRVIRRLDRLNLDGAAAVLVSGPYYQAVTEHVALVRHFRTIAAHSPVPIVIYNIPPSVGYSLPSSVIQELSLDEPFVGLKDSSADLMTLQQYLAVVPGDFPIYQGQEKVAAASFYIGAAGLVSALANLAPQLLRRLFDAVADGKQDEARRLQRNVDSLASIFAIKHFISALMEALWLQGFGMGEASESLPCLDESDRQVLRATLTDPVFAFDLVSGGDRLGKR